LSQARAYVASVASHFHTPLPQVLAMAWTEVLAWNEEAAEAMS
jgi:hypothetical protein